MIDRMSQTFVGSPKRAVLSAFFLVIVSFVLFAYVPAVSVVFSLVSVVAGLSLGLIKIYPNEAKQLAGRVAGYFAWTNRAVERESVRHTIEGTLEAGIDDLRRAAPDAAAAHVHLEFVRSGERVAELPDGTLILSVAYHQDKVRNLVAAAWLYARNGVLPLARRHLDFDVSRGIDFVVTKAILSRADTRAVNAFITDIWVPAITDEARLRELTSKLETLEQDRLFGSILFHEFWDVGVLLANNFHTDEVAAETARFVDELYDLARRAPGQKGSLSFDGSVIRCSWVLVATSETLATKGSLPYKDAVRRAIEDGYPRIYLVARGPFVTAAQEVGAAFKKDPRVLWVAEFMDSMQQSRGPKVPRLVTQIAVDVRQYVGIGQEPIVSVGPNFEEAMLARHRVRRRW